MRLSDTNAQKLKRLSPLEFRLGKNHAVYTYTSILLPYLKAGRLCLHLNSEYPHEVSASLKAMRVQWLDNAVPQC